MAAMGKTIYTSGPDQAEFETTPQSQRRRRNCKRTAGSSAGSKATARRELWKDVDNYIFSWKPERRRSGTSHANNLANGLEHNFEIVAKVDEPGWKDGKRLSRCWVGKKMEVRNEGSLSTSEARHHGLKWDQIWFCVSEDLV